MTRLKKLKIAKSLSYKITLFASSFSQNLLDHDPAYPKLNLAE
jgi:hypothetical protein